MKKNSIIIILSIFVVFLYSCGLKSEDSNKKNDTNNDIHSDRLISNAEIQVYYFHYSIRCETCVAVENETRNDLKAEFPDMTEKNSINFQSINLDDKSNEKLAEKYKIGGQTLIFIKNDKIIDLTNEAFINATVNPTKFNDLIVKTVHSLLKI